MIKRKSAIIVRKSHRYLGLFLGIQFLLWTVSGLYFSWTDIDEIHGDQFRSTAKTKPAFENLLSPTELNSFKISSLRLMDIGNEPYYWINNQNLVYARTGVAIREISSEEALAVAEMNMDPNLKVSGVERITNTGKHHEYRGRPLPAYVISYDHPEAIKAYVAATDGSFQRIRHRSWRWFDFLWMTHTMDYEGRDNFNTLVLRAFSLLGLITVISGFALWFISSSRIQNGFKKLKAMGG